MNHTPENDDAPCRLAILTGHIGDAEAIAARMQGSVANRANGFTAHVGGLCGQPTVVASGGDGPNAAARALDAILMAHRPGLVVAAGLASGLSGTATRGAVILVNEVISETGKRLTLGTDTWRPDGVLVGPILSIERSVRTVQEKQALAHKYGAVAADVDSFALAQACAGASVPFLSLRVITDGPGDELPEDIQFLLSQRSRSAKAGALAGTLMRHPSHLKQLWQWKEAALRASETLADWVVRLAEDL